MKGVVLAGGLGTRLHPLTKITNKALLPVYDRPMIYYPIQTLVDSGINDILIVCGGNAAGDFQTLLGDGEEFGLNHLYFTYQKEAAGIADALRLAEQWANNEPICVVLADNLLQNPITKDVVDFVRKPDGAKIFLYDVDNPSACGVAEIDKNGKVLSLEEKPENPKSNLAAIGIYLYDELVWDFIKRLKPSNRGELEITDVNKHYLELGKLKASKIEGHWADCGMSFDKYLNAAIKVSEWRKS